MADFERTVLEHYQLPTAYPGEWPAEKDLSDASSDEEFAGKSKRIGMVRRSRSRYSALERSASDRRSLVPGSQKTGDGVENLVQKDEPDPLGTADSVVRILKQQGLPVQDDTDLRNRFLLSSTTFSPALFLSQVHKNVSTKSLLQGLDILSRSIDQKSASLKVLVESNFERFVRAKATIDNVYTAMKSQGAERESRAGHHSRHTSRTSYRGSGVGPPAPIAPESPMGSKKKHALLKESEYGTLGIKTPLIDVSAKAEEVWGPALGGREKEESLKVFASTMERYKESYEACGAISDCIRRKDYESLIEEYARAKRFAEAAKRTADSLVETNLSPSDSQVQQIIIAARVWQDVEEQIEAFKREIWRRLIAIQYSGPKVGSILHEQHMELIGILLELGVQDNPIWVWLLSRYDHLKNKIQASADRSRVEIEIMRRRLAAGGKPSPQAVALHLRPLNRLGTKDKPATMDSPEVIELWEKIYSFLNSMLSPQGVLGEVTEFWQTVQGFIDGKTQKTLPVGLNGESRHHHRLSDQGTVDLQKGTIELIDMIRESIFAFFVDPPIEDISSLFSPIPPTPGGSPRATPTPSRLQDPRFTFDSSNPPPPSPRLGETWEKFAFWPPWSNSLSGVYYLSKLLVLVGSGASEMAAVSIVGRGDGSALERLRGLVGGARERCVIAICGAWNSDAENIKVLEDWKRSPDKKDITNMPGNFHAFQTSVLAGMQKILYISEAMAKSGPVDVVLPPPAKLLQMVRSQYATTMFKALSGIAENAERPLRVADDDWTTDSGGLSSPMTMIAATSIGAGTVNRSDRNVRMLLTLSNLSALRLEVTNNLIKLFEDFFSVKLTDETKKIKDVVGQIDARLFQSYTRPAVENLRSIIRSGISSADWQPGPTEKPKQPQRYVYDALLSLVLVHSQVSTTAPTMTPQVMSYFLEQTSKELLEAFKQRTGYTLYGLMQATLEVEFVVQTLNQYTTKNASEIQSAIYAALDESTEYKDKMVLQNELPAMRDLLKKLRDNSRSEFACFKKARRPAERA